jgi:hypothetical protein
MDVAKIQREVLRLRPSQRKKLTAWMVSEFPVLSVDRLMAKAVQDVKAGVRAPTLPTEDNIPKGKTLERVLQVAGQLGIRK